MRSLYDIADPALAGEFIDELIENMADESMPNADQVNRDLLEAVKPRCKRKSPIPGIH